VASFDPANRTIQLQVAGRTDAGCRRSDNQDAFLIADLTALETGGVLLEPDVATGAAVAARFDLGAKGALCMVADGMGGAAAGGLASNVAIASVCDELRRNWSLGDNNSPQHFAKKLRDAVEAANTRIHDIGRSDLRFHGMGTTLTAVGVLDDYLYVAQIGDSRAYLVRNGKIAQITHDQSYIQHLIDSGTITEKEAENNVQRNVILQALGPAPVVLVDLTYQEIRRGDVVIVCSDGLTRVVKRDDMIELAARVEEPGLCCEELVELANLRGGPDNITVVIARIDGVGLREPAETDSIGHQVYTLENTPIPADGARNFPAT
jgi:PPM family protein phosphatase